MFRSRGVMKLGSVAFGAGSFLFFFRRGKFVINHRKSHVLLLDSDHNCVASKKQNLAHRWFLKSLLISQNLWGSFITTALCKAEIPFNFQNWFWKKINKHFISGGCVTESKVQACTITDNHFMPGMFEMTGGKFTKLFVISGWHSAAVISTVASQQEVPHAAFLTCKWLKTRFEYLKTEHVNCICVWCPCLHRQCTSSFAQYPLQCWNKYSKWWLPFCCGRASI